MERNQNPAQHHLGIDSQRRRRSALRGRSYYSLHGDASKLRGVRADDSGQNGLGKQGSKWDRLFQRPDTLIIIFLMVATLGAYVIQSWQSVVANQLMRQSIEFQKESAKLKASETARLRSLQPSGAMQQRRFELPVLRRIFTPARN